MTALTNKQRTVVVLGGINMDLIALTQHMPRPGETVTGDLFYTTPGGKGGNQAVAAARMGAHVHMIGRVGTDTFGPALIDDMRRDGIDVSGIASDPEAASGIAMIMLDGQRQNYITQVRGANLRCDDTQVDAARAALQGADALMLQLELPFDVTLQVARSARAAGVTVLWDPAPPHPDMERALGAVDVITPNQNEAEFLTGVAVVDAGSAARAAQALLDKGIPTVVIKMGEMGAFYATSEESGFVPGFEIEPVDSVAAGDAFGGALAVSMAEGLALPEAVKRGCAAGALACTKQGAQAAMPMRDEVEALLAEDT
jgi:ribokinase